MRRRPSDLVARLRDHVSLLKEYRDRAPTDARFYGEVAAKLRILVCRFGSNVPLLTDLLAHYDYPAWIHTGQHTLTLPEYLNSPAVQRLKPLGTMPDGRATGFESNHISKVNFIRAWAEQAGAAHEDWEIESWLDTLFELRERKITDGHSSTLIGIADDVLALATRFLDSDYHDTWID
ncbi:hypothetical protein LYSHEL_28440 [Lysobacter helvus]|uniref:Uncharacterized protein n=3 Tax=Lysobacterales TaxID=135614 RepID=A0ABM7Q8S6_9GAMM|nr:hypothetical protein LYSCAS_28410 [Lysobacter caseinilyticus]BCT96973.1 hypothetical protein LYSHEL_28440 [Lysobacter helvus]